MDNLNKWMEIRDSQLGERVIVTRRTVDDAAIEEKDGEDEDLVLESRLDSVASKVDMALGTVVVVLEVGVVLCLKL